jgi:hypothetical protein
MDGGDMTDRDARGHIRERSPGPAIVIDVRDSAELCRKNIREP